jgi:hypothetical protein
MKFAQKEFSYYWKIIMIPIIVLVAWGILGFIIGIISYSLYATIFSPLAGWILTIAVFGFIGYTTVKDYKEKITIAAWAGALAGVISGFIGGIIGIFMYYFVPEIIQAAIMQTGQNIAAIESYMQIAMYIGLITGPIISGLVGAAIAALAAFITTKV